MGLLYETLIQMVEAGPLQQPASSATPTADEVSAAQQRFLKAEQAMKTASPQQKTAASEEYRSAWFDYDGKRKAAEAADAANAEKQAVPLVKELVKTPAPPNQPLVTPDQIKALQTALIQKGQKLPPSKLAPDGVDGVLGKNTYNAIMTVLGVPAVPIVNAVPPKKLPGDVPTQNNVNTGAQSESIGFTQDPTLARIIHLAR